MPTSARYVVRWDTDTSHISRGAESEDSALLVLADVVKRERPSHAEVARFDADGGEAVVVTYQGTAR